MVVKVALYAAAGCVAIIIVWLLFRSYKKNSYRFLGSPYRPAEGGSRGEYNEECLEHPGQKFCMLTDGTAGICVLSGMCVADMEIDHRTANDENPKPYCTKPIFKEGCPRFCNCLSLKGQDYPGCVEDCLSYFSPL
jgi:hypothetical protein